jgi:ABC-2 type transport system ATP-binding protein
MILTTHYMEEAEQLCDYIIIIDNGQILKEGTLKQLLAREGNGKIIEFTLEEPPQASMPPFEDSSFNICWDYQTNKGTVSLDRLDSELPVFFKFLENNDMRLKNFEFRRKTLDDLFTKLTGRHLDE